MKRSTRFYRMASGRLLTDADFERMATEAENTDFDLSNMTWVVPIEEARALLRAAPVQLDAELEQQVRTRAAYDGTTEDDLVKTAVRRYLAS